MNKKRIINKLLRKIAKLLDKDLMIIDVTDNKKQLIGGHSKNIKKSIAFRKINKLKK